MAQVEANVPLHLQGIHVAFRYFRGRPLDHVWEVVARRAVQILAHLSWRAYRAKFPGPPGHQQAENLRDSHWTVSIGIDNMLEFHGPGFIDDFDLPTMEDGIIRFVDFTFPILLSHNRHYEVTLTVKKGTFNAQPAFDLRAEFEPRAGAPPQPSGRFCLYPTWLHLNPAAVFIIPRASDNNPDEIQMLARASFMAKRTLCFLWQSEYGNERDNKVYWDPSWRWQIAKSRVNQQFQSDPSPILLPTYIIAGTSWAELMAARGGATPPDGMLYDNSGYSRDDQDIKSHEIKDCLLRAEQRDVFRDEVRNLWGHIRFIHKLVGNTWLARVKLTRFRAKRTSAPVAEFYLYFCETRAGGGLPLVKNEDHREDTKAPEPDGSIGSVEREPKGEVKGEMKGEEAEPDLRGIPPFKTKKEGGEVSDDMKNTKLLKQEKDFQYDLATRHRRHSFTSRLRHFDLATNSDSNAPAAEMSRRQETIYGSNTVENFRRKWWREDV